jgi:putative heme-binding domain-containing protein
LKPLPLPELTLETGFEISVWAENPLLAKPIQMNFDPNGRLWVASSSVYPQISPGQSANDKILILEDTDGDGKADKSTVFADGLLIPTGIEPGDGGAYVGQSTELLHLKDTDGDGKADQKRVVLSGFGTEDTHHILHTLRWGHDGQLYMNQSIYIHSHLETPHGVVRLNSGGTLSLRPPTMEVEVFMKGLVNAWGHHFDEFGQSFATDGAGGAPPNGIFYIMPGGMYNTYAGARRILTSISPGSYPKLCGLEIIRSEHFPKEWQGNLITCDFRANRVVRFSVEEQGSAYVTKEMPDLIRSTNVAFRPIDVKLGPDGALYIADWSNPIIQHGEVDFRDPRRDHEHGRIWRLTAKGRPLVKKPALVQASNGELFEQLLSPNNFNREKAKRVLTERGPNILADLSQWTAKQTAEKSLLEALWMHQAIDVAEPVLLGKLLEAKDGRIRAAATRVLGHWQVRMKEPLELLAKRVADDFPRVRLEALRALARIPSTRSADLALNVLDKPMDPFLEYAAWLTINDLALPWSGAVESGAWKTEGREKQLEFGLKSIEPALAQKLLAKLLKGKTIPRDGAAGTIELIGQAGGPQELRLLLDAFLKGLDEAAALRAVAALEQAARLRNAKPSGDLEPVGKPLYPVEKIHAAVLHLIGTWKLGSYTADLLSIAGDNTKPAQLREAAFFALREIGGQIAISGLRELTAKTNDERTRRPAAVALAAIDLNNSTDCVVDVIRSATHEEDALGLWRSLLALKGVAPGIARALHNTGLPEITARAGLRVAREGAHANPDLIIALARAAGLSEETQNLTEAELNQLAAKVKEGDPARGEAVYRRKELGCVVCHAIAGAGGRVGPDLASIGASAPLDYLVESVLAPNKKVKEGYHSIQVTTKDGMDLSGITVRETSEELVLRDATNKEISVPKKNIDTRTMGGSLMPAGLIDFLSEGQRLDLLRFLSELGKPGPYDASKGNVARVWHINTSTAPAEEILKGDVSASPWLAFYTTLNGALLKTDLDTELSLPTRRDVFFAATRFQTAKGGPVKLRLEGITSPKAWLDGKPIGGNTEMAADLAAGTHTFIVKLDPSQLPDQIRLETGDGSFLAE